MFCAHFPLLALNLVFKQALYYLSNLYISMSEELSLYGKTEIISLVHPFLPWVWSHQAFDWLLVIFNRTSNMKCKVSIQEVLEKLPEAPYPPGYYSESQN